MTVMWVMEDPVYESHMKSIDTEDSILPESKRQFNRGEKAYPFR
jgi:hypothetical protein